MPSISLSSFGETLRASTLAVPPPMRARSHVCAFASAFFARGFLPCALRCLMNGLRFWMRFVNGTPLKSIVSIAVRSSGPSQKYLFVRNSLRSVAPFGMRR